MLRLNSVFLFLSFFYFSDVNSQIRSYNLEVSCKSRTYNSTLSILDFKWVQRAPTVDTQRVFRKLKDDFTWGAQYKILRNADTTFSDTITTGNSYEYKFEKDSGLDDWTVYGFIHAGHRVPAVTFRGKILIIADSTHKTFLDTVLRTFRNDLTGDGWLCELKWFDTLTTVAQIKAYIVGRYNTDPSNVKSVVLFGNLAVPYSGNFSAAGDYPPDGHTAGNSPGASHEGAWAADCYYGDMLNPIWPDSLVNNTLGADNRNHNVPNDGKFDPTFFPGLLQLQVGRIDLSEMPAFSLSERDLLKQYLNKNHDFRHKLVSIKERCLIDDNLGIFAYPPIFSEHFAGNAYRNMAPLIADTVTYNLDYRATLDTADYLWSFGFGAGSYTNCSGVATTAQLASSSQNIKSVFSGFLGSYFLDWDTINNFLRAPLAAKGNVLNTFSVGRPQSFLHHMGLGETIGYGTLRTQNNFDSTQMFGFLYPASFYTLSIHIALMGDPSIRMQAVEPAHNLIVRQDSCNLRFKLRWTASSDTAIHNYYILRANHIDSSFTLLGNTSNLNYIDNNPLTGNNVYMLRGEKLQFSGSGTYFNLSQGIFDTISTSEYNIPIANAGRDTAICNLQNIKIGVHSVNNATTIFSWNPGGFSTDTVTVQVTGSGFRVLIATDTLTGCIRRDTVIITVLPLPETLTAVAVNSFCSDTVIWSSTLNNGSGFNYSWNFQGALSYNVSGNQLNAPDTVVYGGPGSYFASLTVTDTLSLCSHKDSQAVTVSCIGLTVGVININCTNTTNGKQVNFVVYENDKYDKFIIEGLIDNKWQMITSIPVHQEIVYTAWIDGLNYSEIRIKGSLIIGEIHVLDYCNWQNHQSNDFYIFPIPVHDKLQVNYNGTSGQKSYGLRVYNALGLEIIQHSFELLHNDNSIHTAELPAGVYFLMITLGEKSWSFKFVKE